MRGIEFYTTHFLICGNIDGKEKRGANRHLQQKYIERKDFIMKKTILLFSIILTLSLCSCINSQTANTQSTTSNQQTTTDSVSENCSRRYRKTYFHQQAG